MPVKKFSTPWKAPQQKSTSPTNKPEIGSTTTPDPKRRRVSEGSSFTKTEEERLNQLLAIDPTTLDDNQIESHADTLESTLQEHLEKERQLDRVITERQDIFKAGNADGKVEDLTEKWIQICQRAIFDLKDKLVEPLTTPQLLSYLQLDELTSLLRYDEIIDGFI
ncbi:hypothetical protein PROFUN_02896 [Planoprotostelium fungivorum]|uniref:Swi5-dependent recombination DNA repair protein 1 homolog n=1 Tax=Planoprotostelium fungivorum TaxID=1890364 RepID=A0A2P6NS18_9EUKA|nr:hypothetical protein PROFUN_02896 [Planoprotostelium fungivorum]